VALAIRQRELGAQLVVSEDNDSYGVAAAELGLSHQRAVRGARKEIP
jgi:hypothetical protein